MRNLLLGLFIVGMPCLLYAYFLEPYWMEVNEIILYTEKLEATDLTLVHISDLHCDPKVRNEESLAKIINPLQPDVIIFTGDAINSPAALELFQKTLKGLKAKIGKFAVRGNFDVW